MENKEEQRGLLLDELLGQEEIVIKSLGEALKRTRGLAGGAILGDGRVGLILDIAGFFDLAEKQTLTGREKDRCPFGAFRIGRLTIMQPADQSVTGPGVSQ